jgi:hypothetical protein
VWRQTGNGRRTRVQPAAMAVARDLPVVLTADLPP